MTATQNKVGMLIQDVMLKCTNGVWMTVEMMECSSETPLAF